MKWYTEDGISKETLEAWALKHGKTAKQVRKRRGNIRRLIRFQQAARAEEAIAKDFNLLPRLEIG